MAVLASIIACGIVTGEPIKPPVVAQTCDAGACGPAPALLSYHCTDGTIAGPTGRCILNQDGTCGWEIVACPPSAVDGGFGDAASSCTDTMCGPRPLVANQMCEGGAVAGEACVRLDGACGWVFVPCP